MLHAVQNEGWGNGVKEGTFVLKYEKRFSFLSRIMCGARYTRASFSVVWPSGYFPFQFGRKFNARTSNETRMWENSTVYEGFLGNLPKCCISFWHPPLNVSLSPSAARTIRDSFSVK